jgi:hypothetical protein
MGVKVTSMGSSAFDQFVQMELASFREPREESFNWKAEKERWLGDLNVLFSQVEEYLKPYVDGGQITIEFGNVELNEENIGPYLAPVMIIRIGRKTINLEPVGTLLIGSRGRVDVIGPTSRSQLLLLDSKLTSLRQLVRVSPGFRGETPASPTTRSASEIDWAWRIVTRPPEHEVVEVNKDSFLNLLLEIANG